MKILPDLSDILIESEGPIFLNPMFSSRSYKSGQYDLMSEGDTALFMPYMQDASVKTVRSVPRFEEEQRQIYMTVPRNSNYATVEPFFKKYLPNLHFVPIDYGMNAAESRHTMMDRNLEVMQKKIDEINPSVVISSFGDSWQLDIDNSTISILMLMLSPAKGFDRPVNDHGISLMTQIGSFDHVFVRNTNQAEFFGDTNNHVRILKDSFKPSFSEFKAAQVKRINQLTIDAAINVLTQHHRRVWFFPWRINDPEFHFVDFTKHVVRVDDAVIVLNANDAFDSIVDQLDPKFIEKQLVMLPGSDTYYTCINNFNVEIPIINANDTQARNGPMEVYHLRNGRHITWACNMKSIEFVTTAGRCQWDDIEWEDDNASD